MALSKPSYNVYIEGNIAAGKSTLLNLLQKELGPLAECVSEPLNMWTNFNGHNLLASMYSDNPQAFQLQTFIQLTMARIQIKSSNFPIKITERSLLSERFIFIENLKSSNLISELEYLILVEWFDFLHSQAPAVSEIIYLRTDPESAFSRLKSRARLEEKLTTFSYIKNLHDLHESWLVPLSFKTLSPVTVTIIDANLDIRFLQSIFKLLAHRLRLIATNKLDQPNSIQFQHGCFSIQKPKRRRSI